MSIPGIKSFRLKNFKAVRDSGVIKFTPLTVFIGNNGSGKSSVIEGLETLQMIATDGIRDTMQQWGGFEQIWNKAVPHDLEAASQKLPAYYQNAMSFGLEGALSNKININISLEVTRGAKDEELLIRNEHLSQRGRDIPSFNLKRDSLGHVTGNYIVDGVRRSVDVPYLVGDQSLFNLNIPGFRYDASINSFINRWQFLSMIPQNMGERRILTRTGRGVKLEKDGSNIAEYLLDIKNIDSMSFVDIVETMRYVLPYSQDLQIAQTSELVRSVYLQLVEGNFKVPGWLLSTGTLRIVALLALLRHPEPSPVILIEEIENGLDPRSVHLIVREIRNAVEQGRTQIIMTTHSPFLLNLLDLSQIVLTERIDGQPVFTRPADQETLQQWSDEYGPGDLYVMSKLSKER
jgi:predicted ATPase